MVQSLRLLFRQQFVVHAFIGISHEGCSSIAHAVPLHDKDSGYCWHCSSGLLTNIDKECLRNQNRVDELVWLPSFDAKNLKPKIPLSMAECKLVRGRERGKA